MFTEKTIQEVWNNAKEILNQNPSKVRMDICNAIIWRNEYGNRNSEYGWEIDHIIPKAKGGGDYLENFQLLCGNCNRMKGDRTMEYLRMKLKKRAEKRGDKDTAVRASNKAWDGSEGGGRNYRNFNNGIDFQNDMDTDKAYKSLHKIFNHSVKESIDSFTSDLLPRKGWKTLATWKLNIEYNGELVYAIENRPENGEVFLLSNESDGYHVIGYFSDLEPSQQDAIKNLLMQKMGVM